MTKVRPFHLSVSWHSWLFAKSHTQPREMKNRFSHSVGNAIYTNRFGTLRGFEKYARSEVAKLGVGIVVVWQ